MGQTNVAVVSTRRLSVVVVAWYFAASLLSPSPFVQTSIMYLGKTICGGMCFSPSPTQALLLTYVPT